MVLNHIIRALKVKFDSSTLFVLNHLTMRTSLSQGSSPEIKLKLLLISLLTDQVVTVIKTIRNLMDK